jgi:tetratricopeptide (TPR) repeat protein
VVVYTGVAMPFISLRGRLAALALSPILLLVGCRSAYNYFERGNTEFAQGKFTEASLDYRKAVQKDPSFGEAYYRSGLTDLKLNRAAEALQDLQTAVQLMPANDAAKTDLTNLMLGAYIGDPKRPKFLYDLLVRLSGEWLKRDPNSLQGLRIEGYLAMLEQRPEEAVTLFRHAYQSSPRDEKIVDGLMDALFRANQPAEAEKVGLEFVATNGGAPDTYDALFRIYTIANRTQDAENILARKVSANPKERSYILELATFYARQNKKPELDQTMRKFLASRADDARVHGEAGDFYQSIGNLTQALDQYRTGAAADKKNDLLYQNRIARVLLLQNNRKEALQILNATLARHPDDPEARALRAALLVGSPGIGKPGQGVEELRALLEKKPDDLFMKFLLARALAESQNYPEARSRLLDIVKLQPHFLDAQLLLADIAFKQKDMGETLRHTEAAMEVDPENLRARMLRGSALLQQGNLDQADTVLNGLARQVPESVDVRLQLAYVSLNRRNYAAAETAFGKVLQDHPGEVRAVAGLVDTDLAQHLPEKAFSRLESELARSHGSPALRHLLAATALRNGKYNVAIENLRTLSSQVPNSIDPQIELAEVFQLKGDIHDSIVTLQRAAVLQPKDPRPGIMLPFLLESENRAQEAKQVARRALAARPKDPIAMNNLAYLLAETGDSLDEAVKLSHEAVKQAPNNPIFLDTLGFVYLKRDQNDDALDIFDHLIRRYPDDPACAYHTAMAWYQKGDRERAKTLLSHALDLRPPKEIKAAASDLLNRIN